MRLLVFLPDDAALKGVVEKLVARWPRKTAAEIAGLPKRESFVVLDPPTDPEELKKLDAAGGLRALFVIPKETTAFRDAIKPAYLHFHRGRRCRVVQVTMEKAIAKAVKLESKSTSIIRWGAVLPMAVFVGLLALGLLLCRDLLLKKGAVAGLQFAFGAKADVHGLFSGFAPSVNMNSVAVANRREPMSNLFEFDKLAAGVELAPLFNGHVHISEMTLEGLKFGTARTESGELPTAPPLEPDPPAPDPGPTFEQRLEELLKKLEPPALEDLETVRKAREVEEEARKRLSRYEETVQQAAGQLDEAKKTLESLQKLEPPASVKAVQEKLKELGSLRPESLEAAAKEIEAAALLNFDEEKKAITVAKADAEAAKGAVVDAQAIIEKAKAIQKVGLTDMLKVKKLIDDIKKSKNALEDSTTKLSNDARALDGAKQSITKKKGENDARIRRANDLIENARKVADSADIAKKVAEVADLATKAKADIEAQQAEIAPKLKKIQDDVQAARDAAERFKKQVEDDVAWMKRQPDEIKGAIERDKEALLKRYSLDQLGADELVEALFGEKAAQYLRWGLRAYGMVKPYLVRKKEPRVVERAPSGTTYRFPVPVEEAKEPAFWIKKGSFSGIVGDSVLKGTIADLSSDPGVIGKDGRMEFSVETAEQKISITLVISSQGAVSVEIVASGFKVGGRKIENRIAPADISDGTLSLRFKASLGPEAISATGRVELSGLKVTPGKLDRRLGFLEEVYRGFTGINADIELHWANGRIGGFRCRSDKGKEITKSLTKALSGQIEEAKKLALGRFDEQVAGPRKAAQTVIDAFTGKAKPDALIEGIKGVDPGPLASRSAELTKLVSMSGDPKAAVDDLKKQLGAMSAQSNDTSKRNEAAAGEQSGAVDDAGKLVGDQSKALDGLKAELQAQIDRITKLIK